MTAITKVTAANILVLINLPVFFYSWCLPNRFCSNSLIITLVIYRLTSYGQMDSIPKAEVRFNK